MAQRSSIRRSAIAGGALVGVLVLGVSAAAYKYRDTTPETVNVVGRTVAKAATGTPTADNSAADNPTADNPVGSTDPTVVSSNANLDPSSNSVPPLAALDIVTGSTIVPVASTVAPTTTSPTSTVPPVTGPVCGSLDGTGARVAQFPSAPRQCLDPKASYSAIISTKQGEIRIVLNARDTPIAVNNFVYLARNKFYDGLTFHRIIPGFIIQGGDPQGNGQGGPGYEFADELPSVSGYPFGSVAMASAGPNTNGSQFFIVSGDLGLQLPPSFTLFGKVSKGADVVKAINAMGKPAGDDGTEFPPTEIVTIEKIRIVAVNEKASRIPALNEASAVNTSPSTVVSTTTAAP